MKTKLISKTWWVCAVCLLWAGAVGAQEEAEPGMDEPVASEELVEEEVPATSEEPAADEEAGEGEPILIEEEPADEEPVVEEPVEEPVVSPVDPIQPSKPRPVRRGSEMGAAFAGAGSSRFGVGGRVNAIPAKQKKAVEKPEGAWRGRLELGLDTAQGNTETLRTHGSISGSKETEANAYFLKVAGRYGESDAVRDTENAEAEAKFQHRLSERMYAAVDGNVLHDPVADLSYRARGSLSLGRHFVRTGRTVLSAELGPGYVAEKKGGEEEGFVAGRAAQVLEFLVTDSLQIWQSIEFVQNLEDSRVYFVNTKVGLETVLLANLSLRFSVEDRFDSQPAEGKESNDLLTGTSLNWSF